MTKQEKFINYLSEHFFQNLEVEDIDPDILDYWESLKLDNDKPKKLFTENGKLILTYMREHLETDIWTSKTLAAPLSITPRGVSGAMNKLVNDGYVEKVSKDPVSYKITENGKNITLGKD